MERFHSLNRKLIVIDGVDYSGKTTLTRLLAEQGFVIVKSPSNDEQGKSLVQRVFKDLCQKEESLQLFIENNRHLSNVLCEEYANENVALDRFYFSTIAYHSVFLSHRRPEIQRLMDEAKEGLVVTPHKYFVLDVPLSERLRRARERDPEKMTSEKMDSLYLHEFVCQEFQQLANNTSYGVVLDGTLSQDDLVEQVIRASSVTQK